mmetsp:Transcript_11037/g.45042  ORF Transcript_11037/g.45042 Transcript_11037/m.45042 type:complete len:313 (-) Transcript_11037:70-1008(-)
MGGKAKKRDRGTAGLEDDKIELEQQFLDGITQDDLELMGGEEIQVDFEFFNPKESDRDSMIFFSKDTLGPGKPFDARSLAMFAIKQYWVGTCIRVVNSEECFGYVSIVNLHTHNDLNFVLSLLLHFRSKALAAHGGEQSKASEKLLKALTGEEGDVGFIVNERTESIPPLLAPHLHDHLHQEVIWAVEEEVEEQHPRYEFNYEYYLLQSPVFYEKPKAGKKVKRSRAGDEDSPPQEGEEVMIYVHPEDEVYEAMAEAVVTFPVEKLENVPSPIDGRNVREERRLILVHRSKIVELRAALHTHFGTVSNGFDD